MMTADAAAVAAAIAADDAAVTVAAAATVAVDVATTCDSCYSRRRRSCPGSVTGIDCPSAGAPGWAAGWTGRSGKWNCKNRM